MITAMKKISLTLILLGTVLTSSLAQKDPAAKAILDAMSQKYKNTASFKANFSYTMDNPEEDISEGFEGSVIVKGQMYRLYMGGQEIMFDGENIWTYLKEDKEVTVTPYEEDGDEISLSNIFDLYKDGYKYLYLESRDKGKTDVIDLVPEDLSKSFFKIRMEIAAADRSLKSFMIFDKSASKYVYTIKSYKQDSTIKDSDFSFDTEANPDVEVIDFR